MIPGTKRSNRCFQGELDAARRFPAISVGVQELGIRVFYTSGMLDESSDLEGGGFLKQQQYSKQSSRSIEMLTQ